MSESFTLQITSVWPGMFGGAIFKGAVDGGNRIITCKASYKNIDRAPLVGEFWKVKGQFSDLSSKYNKQLIPTECRLTALPSYTYVSSLLEKHPAFRGFYLGKNKIDKLIKEIGAEALVALLNTNNSTDIADVINLQIAEKLVAAWSSLNDEIETINFLIEHRFDIKLSRKVIKLCKTNTVDRLKRNPYSLVCFGSITKNIWRTIEACANKLSIPKDDYRRLVGGIEHVLYERLRRGHTSISKMELISLSKSVLSTSELSEKGISEALNQKAICAYSRNGETYLQAIGPAYIEYSIEKRLKRLICGTMQNSLFDRDIDGLKKLTELYSIEYSEEHGYDLTSKQIEAVITSLSNRCSVLTGFGGTGKTTVLRAVVEISKELNKTVYQMALSGKAKERMTFATGHNATTIHSFIQAVEKGSINIDESCDPLIIIDEASMVDIATFNKLLALFDGKPFSLLTVGDTSQLSPVGFGLVWHLMATSKDIPITHLTEVHRTDNNSLYDAAMKVREGKQPILQEWNGEKEGVFLVSTDAENLLPTISKVKKSIINSQILTPHMSENTKDSGHTINSFMQYGFNDQAQMTKGIRVGKKNIYINDPIIVTENNYDLGLYNGMTGKLLSVLSRESGEVFGEFSFDNSYSSKELSMDQMYDIGIQLAYAITVHKSQGSEYDAIIVCSVSNTPFIERSLIYTAITRAKKLCLIVGVEEYLHHSIKRLPHASTLCVGLQV